MAKEAAQPVPRPGGPAGTGQAHAHAHALAFLMTVIISTSFPSRRAHHPRPRPGGVDVHPLRARGAPHGADSGLARRVAAAASPVVPALFHAWRAARLLLLVHVRGAALHQRTQHERGVHDRAGPLRAVRSGAGRRAARPSSAGSSLPRHDRRALDHLPGAIQHA